MVERKLYKTKLCVLYQRGHCPRQSCSFAHGEAELRRSLNGRRDYHGSDLREKLDRRRSPLARYSPERDRRGRRASNGESPQSLGRISDRKRRKKQRLEGQSDFPESLRLSDVNEDKVKDLRQASSGSKDILDEQLSKVQSEIRMLDDHKHRLEIYLEERNEEASSLTSRIQVLEVQLSQEKEESKRITSKIKKFVKAYNRQLRLEDELKRLRVQLQKVGEQLGLGVTGPGTAEDDPGLNNMSDGESDGNKVRSSRNELQENVSPSNKRRRVHLEMKDISNQAGNPTQSEGIGTGKARLDKHPRRSGLSNSSNTKKVEANGEEKNVMRPSADDYSSKRSKNASIDIAPFDKFKGFDSSDLLPSTSMAARAVDEVVHIVETVERFEVIGSATGSEREIVFKVPALPFPPPPPPPPPPILENAYAQYKGDDENVDIDGIEEESVEVDIV